MGPIQIALQQDERTLVLSAAPADRVLDLCDAEEGLTELFSCRSASCGVCVVTVESGESLLAAPEDTERETLELLGCGSETRLLCQLRVRAQPAKTIAQAEVRLRLGE
jgi:ferredoxin